MARRSPYRRGLGGSPGPNGGGHGDAGHGGHGDGWDGKHERYFAHGEHRLYSCRRHPAVLESPAVILLVSVVLFVFAVRGMEGGPVRILGAVVLVAGGGYFAGRFLQWWMLQYVLTNARVLLVEGVLCRRVRGVPLELVIDTDYRRTLGGRLLGYGDLDLNLSGQPGLRTLTMLPQPDVMYRWIVSLTGRGGAPRPGLPEPPGSPDPPGPSGSPGPPGPSG